MAQYIEPVQYPNLNLPSGDVCCDISIINTTTDIVCNTNALLEPAIQGHEQLNLPTYSFYIKNQKSGAEILYDLGARKDWWNTSPTVKQAIMHTTPGLRVKKGVDEILQDEGLDLKNIRAIILSHWHWDHIGDPSKFSPHTDLVVGPGFKESFIPAYPEREDGVLLQTDVEGRHIQEIDFSNAPKIGQFPAFDYFGDGSIYILDVPGHAVGHISALVRDTPTTFVFLGGDITHFGGVFRPSRYIPLPTEIPNSTILDPGLPCPCPCSFFTACHPIAMKQSNSASESDMVAVARTTPFYSPSQAESSWYLEPLIARQSINNMAEFDANPNVLVVLAHDPDSEKYFDFFPVGKLNEWKRKNWKEGNHWSWLNELPKDGKAARKLLVEGRWRDGVQTT